MALLIRIEHNDDKSDVKIRLETYENRTDWVIDSGYHYASHEGSVYNHDPEDVLGILSKIYAATGKI